MGSLRIYLAIVAFWVLLGIGFLISDALYGFPRIYLRPLNQEVSAAWPCFFLAGYSAIRLVLTFFYQQRRLRQRVADEARYAQQQRAARRPRPEGPPDPNFQFDPPGSSSPGT
jgi:hypothetical protein